MPGKYGSHADYATRAVERDLAADKLKLAFPHSKFGAVVYHPFIEEHINIPNHLRSDNIDSDVFASEVKNVIKNLE